MWRFTYLNLYSEIETPGGGRVIQQELLKKGFQMVANVVRYDPFTNLRQTMDRLFDDSFFRTPSRLFDEGTLPVDISEQEGELLVKASLPGFETEEIDVQEPRA